MNLWRKYLPHVGLKIEKKISKVEFRESTQGKIIITKKTKKHKSNKTLKDEHHHPLEIKCVKGTIGRP